MICNSRHPLMFRSWSIYDVVLVQACALTGVSSRRPFAGKTCCMLDGGSYIEAPGDSTHVDGRDPLS